MSNLIRSTKISFGDEVYKISSDITISKSDYLEEIKDKEENFYNNLEMFELEEDFNEDNFNEEGFKQILEENKISKKNVEDEAQKIIEEAHIKAQEIIDESKEAALKIEEDSLQKANDAYEDSRNRGYEDGFNQGLKKSQQEGKIIIDEAIDIKHKNMNFKNEYKKNIEEDVLNLSIEIAKKILNKEIEKSDYIENLIKIGIEKLVIVNEVVVRVSKDDFEFANQIKDRIYAMAEKIDKLEIKEDLSLEKGDCVIENSSTGSINVGIKSQMAKIEEEFKNYLRLE